MYYKLTSTYTGADDISFGNTVLFDEDNTDKFIAIPSGMPYVAGLRGGGLEFGEAVAELTSSGATLEIGILGYETSKSNLIAFMQAISVEYAWVDEAV